MVIHIVLASSAVLFKDDSARRIDRVIDYFGEASAPPAASQKRQLPLLHRKSGGG